MSANDDAHAAERRFDGVICFGGLDWWYHNRGHYDLQMMRELSRRMPVLYINSIAMRVPKLGEGRMFFKRVARKWKSLRRGLVKVRPTFGVFSPFSIPGGLGTRVSRPFVPGQIRRAARDMGIHSPLVWVACPPGERFLDALRPAGVVYQRTDKFEAFKGVDPEFIGACNRSLQTRSDVTLFASHLLMDAEEKDCKRAVFIDHGVDYDTFADAGRRADEGEADEPADVAAIPRPRVGFVGGIDAHTFDPPLFVEVARSLPNVHFVLVGSCSLPEGWCDLANVHLLGQRPYEDVARYMAASDVLIMPWNESDWIHACNPVKLKEYLAVGRPIVSTNFYELGSYDGLVRVATTPADFTSAVQNALDEPFDPTPGRERVESATWSQRAQEFLDRLAESGVTFHADGKNGGGA